MRWQGRRESENVEDRRDGDGGYDGGGGGFGMPFPGGGGGFQIPMGQGGGLGLVGVLVIFGIALLLGVDPRVILGGGDEMPGGGRQIQLPDREPRVAADDDSMKRFVSAILADTEDTWTKIFRDQGQRYTPPKLVLFRNGIQSGCGLASSQMGPFYCPANRKIYVDLSFYDLLKRRFKAPGGEGRESVIRSR